ncbi:hypothetical protein NDU88_006733 [Pleurodeles waltl]|uniref:Uncharacterized protein n=1 Tax=Pleurodeles waltl TaxID=8319 RepID=A0AAV7X1I6_PLEWA|nr:hypothetical protein NDU88_006733 [Pleurodeles waltl]
MAADGSDATKESGACGSGPTQSKQRVRPMEWECSELFTAPLGAKWQAMALMPRRSLWLVIQAPPSKQRVCPVERECSNLFTAPLGTKSQTADLMPPRSQGLVVRVPPEQAESSSRRVGMQQTFHHASGSKMAGGGSDVAKKPGACGSATPRGNRVRLAELEFSDLFTTPPGAKWQPEALMPQRSLGLVVPVPPRTSREFVPRSLNSATF